MSRSSEVYSVIVAGFSGRMEFRSSDPVECVAVALYSARQGFIVMISKNLQRKIDEARKRHEMREGSPWN